MATIRGGNGKDTLPGTSGPDLIEGGNGKDESNGKGGNDTILGGNGRDVLAGGYGDDLLCGGNGDDVLTGGGDNDVLHGGRGDDLLSGSSGCDTIHGGNGDDVIEGGDDIEGILPIAHAQGVLTVFAAGDVLTGGKGSDTFRFDGDDDDHDLITDFTRGEDRLEISDVPAVQQVVITGGVHGAGLLIVHGDDAMFLQGVSAPLTVGTDIVFV